MDEAPTRLRRKPSWLIGTVSARAHRLIGETMAAAGSHAYPFAILAALARCAPDSQERLRTGVVGVDVAADCAGQLVDRAERAAPYRLPGDDPEEDLDHVQPGPGGRGELQRDPRILGQPRGDLGSLAGGVVVADHV